MNSNTSTFTCFNYKSLTVSKVILFLSWISLKTGQISFQSNIIFEIFVLFWFICCWLFLGLFYFLSYFHFFFIPYFVCAFYLFYFDFYGFFYFSPAYLFFQTSIQETNVLYTVNEQWPLLTTYWTCQKIPLNSAYLHK